MPAKYTITLSFFADRGLTSSEKKDLMDTIMLQLEEPYVQTEDGFYESAEYSTSQIEGDITNG